MDISEGDNGQTMQTDLCITLESRGTGLLREANFILNSVNDNTGETGREGKTE